MKILVGADPEMFAFVGGKAVSAHGLIPGTKHEPFVVEGGAVQVDGMALEFNINPAKDEAEFLKNINLVIETMRSMVPGYDVVAEPVAEFGEDYMATQPPEALELGCEPDYDAWNDGDINRKPNAALPFRTGAGHVHIGWTHGVDAFDGNHMDKCIEAVKQLDFFLGLPSLLYDKGTKRRTMYGKPGCFRPKSYGVEYRVLSNQWLKDNKLMSWVYKNTNAAMQRMSQGDLVFKHVSPRILTNLTAAEPDLGRVRSVLKRLNIELPPVMGAA